MSTIINKLLNLLTRPIVMVAALPWLMVLLVLGTVSQRELGLYAAEQIFFSSPILWLGFIPLPGTVTVLAVITVSLAAKIILKSPWKPAQAGTIITHMGALLLLIGGLLTALTSEEGYLMLAEGENSSSIGDYHARELAIFKNGETTLTLPFEALTEGASLGGLPFTARIITLCRHCEPIAPTEGGRGLAARFSLAPAPLKTTDEENQSGAVISVSGAGAADGNYLAYELTRTQAELTVEADNYRIAMRRAQRKLPFSVRLDVFEKQTWQGTDIASSYQSTVTVHDGELAWPATIRMNQPLRYRGYTLYQSSFLEVDGERYSVLAVVKNGGRVFPYVASLVMCVGLLVHIYMQMRRRGGKA